LEKFGDADEHACGLVAAELLALTQQVEDLGQHPAAAARVDLLLVEDLGLVQDQALLQAFVRGLLWGPSQ
jgi:hypothetical protein